MQYFAGPYNFFWKIVCLKHWDANCLVFIL